MKKNKFASIQEIIKEAQKGKMFILVDDENRENEGDLVIPASNISPKSINFMAKYGRGLICLALDSRQAKKLNLSLMSPVNKSRMQTAFTVSIEAKKGVTTGISAIDDIETNESLDALEYQVVLETATESGTNYLITEDGHYIVSESYALDTLDTSADNIFFETQGDLILDFSETNPFGEVT